jgi:hypothetical protein
MTKTTTTTHQVTNVRHTTLGVFGTLNGREVEFTYSTRMWFYTDGSGYAYGAQSADAAKATGSAK